MTQKKKKRKKIFFKFFIFSENQNTQASVLLIPAKENENKGVSSRVLIVRVTSAKGYGSTLDWLPKLTICMVPASHQLKGSRIVPH